MSNKNNCSLWIGNIPFDLSEKELQEILSKVGEVVNVRIKYDIDKNVSKGFAFCEYKDLETCMLALKYLNGYEIRGRKLKLYWATDESKEKANNSIFLSNGIYNNNIDKNKYDKKKDFFEKYINPIDLGTENGNLNFMTDYKNNYNSNISFPNNFEELNSEIDFINKNGIQNEGYTNVGTKYNPLKSLNFNVNKENDCCIIKEILTKEHIGNIMHTLTTSQIIYILSYFQKYCQNNMNNLKIFFQKNQTVAYALLHCLFLLNIINDYTMINNNIDIYVNEKAYINKSERALQMEKSNMKINVNNNYDNIEMKKGNINDDMYDSMNYSKNNNYIDAPFSNIYMNEDNAQVDKGLYNKNRDDGILKHKKNILSSTPSLGFNKKQKHSHSNNSSGNIVSKNKGNTLPSGLYGYKKGNNSNNSKYGSKYNFTHFNYNRNRIYNNDDNSNTDGFVSSYNNSFGTSISIHGKSQNKKSLYGNSNMNKYNNDLNYENNQFEKNIQTGALLNGANHSIIPEHMNNDIINNNYQSDYMSDYSHMDLSGKDGIEPNSGYYQNNSTGNNSSSNYMDKSNFQMGGGHFNELTQKKNMKIVNSIEGNNTKDGVIISSENDTLRIHDIHKIELKGLYNNNSGNMPSHVSNDEDVIYNNDNNKTERDLSNPVQNSNIILDPIYDTVDIPDDELVNVIIKDTNILKNILRSKIEDMKNWSDEQRIQVLSIQKALQLKGYSLK
ncbi:mRNA processing protein, putative [Plasmodium berghei]|uniref:CSTF domain-containing protein, putative n=3 Tax=Plasmodium (Vinckeia) TaxID=418101 RepID=A0A509AJ40_PLABA|nr:CSTF domain-containing protein, putative [Plasmodium berghei ANKA]CXI36766.1 mRNA processing protein, putative [Plasmodium berghei]SCM21621.1 mRNA processing protein, putative [Plasmodium berghei]SCN24823.1 mRNA processing protein, putative [Plasmodium berghei]SCO59943.1 mRNA processing protein, putative [Plasmodium berghei]SCO61309.1 mRNA processing protein, putative [Plasmodium berghei]|eukprot:XP_034421312.1 CSTF domain-containing protein, putative [Plasmodium berghei ANKA]